MHQYIKCVIILLIFLFAVGCGDTQGDVQLAGQFIQEGESFLPYIILYEDGTCEFLVNYYEGTCKTEGMFTVTGNKLIVELTHSEPNGFLGEKYENTGESHIAYEQNFTIVDDKTLQINDSVYYTPKDALFIRQEDR